LAKASPGNCLLRASPRPGGQQLAPRAQRDRSDSTNLPVANILISAPRPKQARGPFWGQSRKWRRLPLMSVLPLTTDICGLSEHVGFVPQPDSSPQQTIRLVQSPILRRRAAAAVRVSPNIGLVPELPCRFGISDPAFGRSWIPCRNPSEHQANVVSAIGLDR
jgi:hypothetical protein